MGKTIRELEAKWRQDKEFYKHQEVGSGVQSFVKGVLESKEIFNLKEGRLSTENGFRRREFIHEKSTKGGRSGDFVIFVDSEIRIPIEVECFGNMKAGEKQLRNYQKDLGKKYGILTDGYSWRFYNNQIPITEFVLDDILSDPSLFVEFWKEYIKPEYYYLSFFEERGQLYLFEHKLFVEENRESFFEDITTLIESLRRKLNIEGYFKGLPDKERTRKATEITYAYIIQFILYKTLVDNSFPDFEKEHKQIVERIHRYVRDSRYKDILSVIEGISHGISENVYRPFNEEQQVISDKILLLYRTENKLSDVSPWLDIFVFINKYNFQNVRNEIFGYVYENYLKEVFEEEKRGQYFTDSAVVDFMLQQIGYTAEKVRKKIESDKLDELSIIDPACGSGTFLYNATGEIIKSFSEQTEEVSKQIEQLVNTNVFGLDIAEFPLYLAEMNIIMRMLPLIMSERYNNPVDKKIKVFLTKDSVAEFIGAGLENTDVDEYVRRGQILIGFPEQDPDYESFMRNKDDLEEAKRSLRKCAEMPRRRFDYVVANPPYVTYNECSQQRVLIFDMMKEGKVKLSNVYGVNLHSTPDMRKKRPPKPNLYAFFIATGIALLKERAKLCYIIPQTILTAGDMDVLRYHLAKYVTIEKIITFSGNLFIDRGLGQEKVIPTSSLIFVIRKATPTRKHEVEIINYKDDKDTIEDTLNNILADTKIDKKRILQHDLQKNVDNWNFIKQDKGFLDFYEEYKKNTSHMSIYFSHLLAQRQFKSKFYFDIGYKIDEKAMAEKPRDRNLWYRYPILDSHFWTIRKFKGYWPNIRSGSSKFVIKLLKANQGYNLLDSKYKIIWWYINPLRFHFTDHRIIWARNRYCGIGSDDKQELLYLFAVLNSIVVDKILNGLLRAEREKDYLISISSIKSYVRVPKTNRDNQHIKDEVIRISDQMLNLEKKTLSDFVDFSRLLMQEFKEVRCEKGYLLLKDGDKTTKLQIKYNPELVANTLSQEVGNRELEINEKKVKLSFLRNLRVVDFKKQRDLKYYVDLLVFALCFKIAVSQDDLGKVQRIKKLCSNSKYFAGLTEYLQRNES